eukprot:scaffold151672_cov32-Tisochrysis_lutea.AAC.1
MGHASDHACPVAGRGWATQGPRNPCTARPPSTASVCPVMYEATGRQRKATAAAVSRGAPRRPSGVAAFTASSCEGSLRTASSSKGVRAIHGATVLTRMPRGAHSHARLADMWVRAACGGEREVLISPRE